MRTPANSLPAFWCHPYISELLGKGDIPISFVPGIDEVDS